MQLRFLWWLGAAELGPSLAQGAGAEVGASDDAGIGQLAGYVTAQRSGKDAADDHQLVVIILTSTQLHPAMAYS